MTSASALRATGAFQNSTSGHCPTGAFLLALLLVLFLFNFPPLVFAAENPTDVVDQQRLFLDQTMRNIERQRAEQEADKKAKAEQRLRFEKKRTERRLVEQLKGLSGTLSGLPELPSFNGMFETQPTNQRPTTSD